MRFSLKPVERAIYFTKGEMALLTTQSDYLSVADTLIEHMHACYTLASLLERTADTNSASNVADLEEMGYSLTELSNTLDIAQLVVRNELYAWSLPRNAKDEIEWDEEIKCPPMEPFNELKHAILHPVERSALNDHSDWPNVPLLYMKSTYEKLPPRATTHEYIEAHNADMGQLDKITFHERLMTVRALVAQHKSLLASNDIFFDEILHYFDRPAVKACYMPQAEHGLIYN